MRRLTGAISVVGIVVTIAGAVALQGSIEDRVVGLETRVANLEATIGATNGAELAASADTHELTGVIVVLYGDAASWRKDQPCTGQGGYDDLRAGAQVVVSNSAGGTIATGRLGPGVGLSRVECQFSFAVPDVPASDFYTIEISHRGGLTYSIEDLEALDWHLELNIGTDD